MNAFRTGAIAVALIAAMAAAPAPASASSVELSPITLQLVGKERTTTLRVRNTEAQPITLQLRAVDWSQPQGQDAYTPSRSLVASPPIFTLKPGESQTVRVVVEGLAAVPTEKAYRLILDQIPESQLKGENGVVVPIRVLLPVFLTPSATARPRLSWKLDATPSGGALTVSNAGDTRERLVGLKVTRGEAELVNDQGLSGYVLAGGSRTWPLGAGSSGSTKVSVTGEGLFAPIKADVWP